MKEIMLILALAGLAGCAPTTAPQGSEAKISEADESSRENSIDPAPLMKMHPNVVAVDAQPFATPPRLVMTLKGNGWRESDILHGFASNATSIPKKMAKKELIPADHGITFILRIEVESGGEMLDRNVLHLSVDQPFVEAVAGGANVSAQALLNTSDVSFNGRLGRRLTEQFCGDDKYQGADGVLRTVDFCSKALGNWGLSSS